MLATAPGRKPWKKRVEVVADGANVALAVKALEVDPNAGIRPGPLPDAAPERSWQRPTALVAMGLGVAGVGVGAVLGGLAIAKNGKSNEDNHCDAADLCDATGVALRQDALGLGTASTAALIAGGVVATGGAVLFFTAPSSAAVPDRVGAKAGRWSARLEILPGGMQLRGAWQ